MGMGSPNVFIKEYDLSSVVPSFRGVTGAIIFDSEKGKVNEKYLVTSEKELIDNYGKPLPKKYGLGIYSAINFLKESNKLWAVRVDKGQLYSSLLVRSIIDPIVEYDAYGYLRETPVIDPIVKPLGSLTADEIENYQFVQYPALREVENFTPPIAVIDEPQTGDTVFNVDNIAPIEVGDKVTFKDTTGMSRDETIQYSTYQVIEKEQVVVPIDYIRIDGSIDSVPYNVPIQHVEYTFLDSNLQLVPIDHEIGDKVIYVTQTAFGSPDSPAEFVAACNNRTFTIDNDDTNVYQTVNNSNAYDYNDTVVGIPQGILMVQDELTPTLFKTTHDMSAYAGTPAVIDNYVETTASGTFDESTGVTFDGSIAVNETITVMFTSATAYAVSGSVTGAMGVGSVSTEFAGVGFSIPAALWGGTWGTGETVSFDVTKPIVNNYVLTTGEGTFDEVTGLTISQTTLAEDETVTVTFTDATNFTVVGSVSGSFGTGSVAAVFNGTGFDIPASLWGGTWAGGETVVFDVHAAVVDSYSVMSTGGSYDDSGSPVVIGVAAVDENITVTFSDNANFDVAGSVSGALGSGTIGSDFTPTTNQFTIPAAGWGGTYANNDTLEFSITAAFADAYVETTGLGTYDSAGNSVISGAGAVTETVTVTFSTATAFAAVGSVSGALGSGTVGVDFTASNNEFVIPSAGWGGTWAAGETLVFDVTGPSVSNYVEITEVGVYDDFSHPVVPGVGAKDEIITVTFTSPFNFDVAGSVSGALGSGNINSNFTASGNEFTIPMNGWSGTWDTGETLEFDVASGALSYINLNGVDHTIVSASENAGVWDVNVVSVEKVWEASASIDDYNDFGAVVRAADLEINSAAVDMFDPMYDYVTGRYRFDLTVEGVFYQYSPNFGEKLEDIISEIAALINTHPDLESETENSNTTIRIRKLATKAVDSADININVEIYPEVYSIEETDIVALKLVRPLQSDYDEDSLVRFSTDASVTISNYIPHVLAKEVVAGTTDTIRVDNNDPIAEDDWIVISGNRYRVVEKWQFHNTVNQITVDKTYAPETSVTIGSPLYFVARDDFEHHDAILITAANPGEWGDKIAIAIRDSINYEEAFWIDVYYDGVLVEEWEVARTQLRDGYSRQLFMEDKINVQSQYIRAYNNEFMVDLDTDELVEPLKTLYYIRQPVKTPIWTKASETVETVWDGDNRLRIPSAEIFNIDVLKPVKFGESTYNISTLGSSYVGGPMDTVVLETGVSLGLDNLLPLERYLDIGTPVNQYFDRAEVVDIVMKAGVSFVTFAAGDYKIKIEGTATLPYEAEYVYNLAPSAVGSVNVLEKLTAQIVADLDARVSATLVEVDGPNNLYKITLTSKVAGVDYVVTLTSPNGELEQITIADNAREYEIYKIEKISNSILPTVVLGDTVTINSQDYIIRDAGANRMTGGDDAGFPTVGQYLIALDEVFPNREDVDFLVIMDGGVTAQPYQQRLVEIAEARQDCFALLSADFDAQANPDISAGVLDWRANLNINSSYGAAYTPWTQVYDKYNDFEIWISPESWASRAISWVSFNRELWYVPAGWDHATVNAIKVFRKYTEGQRDILYDHQLNPIRFAPDKGIVIWGQKTLQTKPSPTDRINVRMVLIVIARGLRDYLEYQVFKFNDETTRKRIRDSVNSFLQDIKVRRGLYGFSVVCDESNNTSAVIARNELIVDVSVAPIQAAEYITATLSTSSIRLVKTQSGANFSEGSL